MAKPLRLLIVEDSPDDAELMLLELRRGGFDPAWQRVESAEAMRAALAQGPWDVVLWDYSLPGFAAMSVLAMLQRMDEDLPFIVVTGTIGEEQAVRLMKAGADDFLLKGNLARLAPAVERTLREVADRRARRVAEQDAHRLAAIVQSSEDAIIGETPEGIITSWNPAAERLFGYEAAEVVGRSIELFVPPDDLAETRDRLDRLRRGEHFAPFDAVRLAKGGRPVLVSISLAAGRVEGRIVAQSAIYRDVTRQREAEAARERAEERRRRSEALLAEAQRIAHVGSWSWELDSNEVIWSDEYYRLLGLTPQEGDMTFERGACFTHPDDRALVQGTLEQALRDHQPFEVYWRALHQDGTVRFAHSRGRVELDAAGKPVRMFGSVQDITEHKRAEQALRESEERFRGTFENAAVGIAHVDGGGRFLRVNEKFCAIVGRPRAELPRLTFEDITHPDDLATSREQFGRLMQGEGADFSREERYVRADGSVVWANVSVAVQRDATGAPAYAIAVIEEVSGRKRLEADLLRAKEAAVAANRAKDAFLANVGHEIRTPFGAILGMTELVLETELTEDQRQCLTTARSAAVSLLGLVDDLLDFEKIEAGRLELAPADFSLRATLGDAVQILSVRARNKGLELGCNVDPDAPDALVGDAGRLRQVLLNLLGNAIKFTKQGQVAVLVQATDGPAPGGEAVLRFTVTDTGIGIPPDGRERIFQAFEQADSSTTRRFGGTGLGLTIAARLIGLMGGTIGVESEPGRGSTFAFTARFGRQPHSREQVVARPSDVPSEAATPTPVAAPLRILVAEDNEFNSRHLERLLGRRGHAVRVATAGLEALNLAVEEDFDLLLLDLHMPELDGFQVVQAIRERERTARQGHLPVIALTARARKEDRERCLAAGMDDFLSKPVRAAELFTAIDRLGAAHRIPRSRQP